MMSIRLANKPIVENKCIKIHTHYIDTANFLNSLLIINQLRLKKHEFGCVVDCAQRAIIVFTKSTVT